VFCFEGVYVCIVIICVPDHKMCIFTDNVCNQEVFWVSVFLFFAGKIHNTVYAVGGKST
jgi:hypothetical protein